MSCSFQLHIQMKALKSNFGYLSYWTQEAGYLYKVPFDEELWDLIEEGMTTWREAVTQRATQAPQSAQDKALYTSVWARCDEVYSQVLSENGYTVLPSCKAKPGA